MTHVLVAGGGIGGLTAALALAKTGADVMLFERAAQFDAVGAGLQLSPNATRILDRLGLLDALKARAATPTGVTIRSASSARAIVTLPFHEAEARWGAPYLVALRADLQAVLVEAVTAEPRIDVRRDAVLAGFGTAAGGVVATIRQSGITRTVEGEALIGADGIRSVVRERLSGGDDGPRETGRMAWRALVPAANLDPLFRSSDTGLWLGRDAHLVHYPVDSGHRINIVAITREAPDGRAADVWSTPGPPATIKARFAGWHRTVRDMIASVDAWSAWPLFDRAPLGAWNAGPVALLGDAAHPILPFLAQGSAQAIEDAAALAGEIGATHDLPQALARYSQSRQSRAARVQETSRRLGRIYHLSGPAAVARDTTMRVLGGRALLARYDWLYSPHADAIRHKPT